MQQGSYPIGTRTINVLTDNATGVVTGATCDIPLNLLAQAIQNYLGLTVPLAITVGGTGATTAPAARTNLGLGTIATQDASNVSINGGTINNTAINGTTVTATTPIAVASGGTGANTFTAHGVLIGEGTGTIVATATGTSGQPLLSGGAAADPVYGNLGVAAGGTGRTTLTARSVLIGEGTSAVNFATPATAGQALISTGASSDPIFGAPTGTLIGVQRITSTQTYTPTTGTNSIIFLLLGGGGAGGGAGATGAAQVSIGAGGGGGGLCVGRLTTGFSGVTVTIGAGGTAVSGASGGAGGNSSFGAVATANGGGGGGRDGAAAPPFINTSPGQGGNASGASLVNSIGMSGLSGMALAAATGGVMSGKGGDSTYGGGGVGVATATTLSGVAGGGFGAGGGGATNQPSQAAAIGGNGSPGVCIIYEYA